MITSVTFLGIKDWSGPIVREIEPLSQTNIFFDIRNKTELLSVVKNGKSLEFSFKSKPYERKTMLALELVQSYKLIFHGVQLINVVPVDFIDYKGNHASEAFVFVLDQKGAHIRWEGDTESGKADPLIEFYTNSVEYVSS
jgi:hypothetical protein